MAKRKKKKIRVTFVKLQYKKNKKGERIRIKRHKRILKPVNRIKPKKLPKLKKGEKYIILSNSNMPLSSGFKSKSRILEEAKKLRKRIGLPYYYILKPKIAKVK